MRGRGVALTMKDGMTLSGGDTELGQFGIREDVVVYGGLEDAEFVAGSGCTGLLADILNNVLTCTFVNLAHLGMLVFRYGKPSGERNHHERAEASPYQSRA